LDERRDDAKYRFIDQQDSTKFEQDFRDMDLLDTFDVDSIKSLRKGWGETTNECLKIWRSRDIDQTHTLTFYANHIKEHLEFPIEWLSPDFEVSSRKKEVHISFKQKPGIPNADPRSLPLFGRLSAGKKAKRLAASASEISFASSSGSASIRTMSSTSSSLSSRPTPARVKALADLASSFEYLKIQFGDEEVDQIPGMLASASWLC
jgi:hypothetical protein